MAQPGTAAMATSAGVSRRACCPAAPSHCSVPAVPSYCSEGHCCDCVRCNGASCDCVRWHAAVSCHAPESASSAHADRRAGTCRFCCRGRWLPVAQVQGQVQQLAAYTAEAHEHSAAVVETHNDVPAMDILRPSLSPHAEIGRAAGRHLQRPAHLVAAGASHQRGVHVCPVRQDVQHEREQGCHVPLGVQQAQHHQQASRGQPASTAAVSCGLCDWQVGSGWCISLPVCDHVEDYAQRGGLLECTCCTTVQVITHKAAHLQGQAQCECGASWAAQPLL